LAGRGRDLDACERMIIADWLCARAHCLLMREIKRNKT
jgi:hypothetical protein